MSEPVRIRTILGSGPEKNSGSPNDNDNLASLIERLRTYPCRVCGRAGAECECVAEIPRPVSTLESIGVPAEHRKAELEDFAPAVRGAVASLLASPERSRGLLVTGKPGRGKTRLLAAICGVYLAQGKRVRFYIARRLFGRLWATYSDGAEESEDKVIAELTSCDFLAIDDLGHEGKASDGVLGALHEIVTARHGNFRPTAISTNLSLDEIARRYDESIASRVGAWLPLLMGGSDRRLA